MRDGWQPYSLKIGDKYYSYNGMEPVSAMMAIAADYAEYAKHEPDASKVEEVFLGGTYGLYEFLKEQPYLAGVADVAKLIGTNQQGQVDGKKIVDGLVKQFGGFVIGGSPIGAYSSMLAGIERLSDPTNRDTRASPDLPMGVRGFVEAFNKYRSRLPYFSADLPETLNLWGDETKSGTDRKIITNTDGTLPTSPVCLNGSGAVLANPSPVNAVFGAFNLYPAYDFNLLPLT